MTSPNRVGREESTRSLLVDSTEQIMLDDGYAAVTYRRVAAKAGVSLGAVQYHFPSIDDLFLAVIRQHSERNEKMIVSALQANPKDVLQVLWECSYDELSTALFIEIMALGNHRKSIHDEITAYAIQYRKYQADALAERWESLDFPIGGLTPAAVAFLLACLPRWMRFEDSFGLSEGSADIGRLVLGYLDSAKSVDDSRDHQRAALRPRKTFDRDPEGPDSDQPPTLGATLRRVLKRAASLSRSAAHYARVAWQAWAARRDHPGRTHRP